LGWQKTSGGQQFGHIGALAEKSNPLGDA